MREKEREREKEGERKREVDLWRSFFDERSHAWISLPSSLDDVTFARIVVPSDESDTEMTSCDSSICSISPDSRSIKRIFLEELAAIKCFPHFETVRSKIRPQLHCDTMSLQISLKNNNLFERFRVTTIIDGGHDDRVIETS